MTEQNHNHNEDIIDVTPIEKETIETPQPDKPEKEKNPLKRTFIIGMVSCAVISGGMGFAGGYAAMYFGSGNKSVLWQNPSDNRDNIDVNKLSAGNKMTTQEVAALNQPSVVEIRTEQSNTSSFLQDYVTEGAGSGVIVSQDGYIVTNNHVIEGASNIKVKTSDGTEYTAKLVAADSKTDLAVLKIEANHLQPVVFGDSSALNVGDDCVAIGNPLGQLGGTVTNGIISALDREITLDNQKRNLLQTNAAINPGNSGGGLFNGKGELIGIVVAKSSGEDVEGLGFAIPVNDVKTVVEQLISNGYVSGRPAMGIGMVQVSSMQQAMQYGVSGPGVYISKVYENSAAEKAGLKAGDALVSIGDQAIESLEDITSVISNHQVGDTLDLLIKREGKTMNITVTLQEQTQDMFSTNE